MVQIGLRAAEAYVNAISSSVEVLGMKGLVDVSYELWSYERICLSDESQ